jgi:hypothetical protein
LTLTDRLDRLFAIRLMEILDVWPGPEPAPMTCRAKWVDNRPVAEVPSWARLCSSTRLATSPCQR